MRNYLKRVGTKLSKNPIDHYQLLTMINGSKTQRQKTILIIHIGTNMQLSILL